MRGERAALWEGEARALALAGVRRTEREKENTLLQSETPKTRISAYFSSRHCHLPMDARPLFPVLPYDGGAHGPWKIGVGGADAGGGVSP